MKPIQTACFALIASAFVLSAILIVRIDEQAEPNTADASGMVITQPSFTMMTARTRGNPGANPEESLFILDNNGGVLMIYTADRKQINPLVPPIKMSKLFQGS